MSKERQYIELAKEIRECHICENIKAPAYSVNGECLKNDSYWVKFPEDASAADVYVNRWNLWHGDLNPHVMVIGQDFGKIENKEILDSTYWENTKFDKWKFDTDKRLCKLFGEILEKDIIKKNPDYPLYFTNIACCYRTKDSTSQANESWYPICASRYLGRLIKIVKPKMIICLGQIAFNCMGCLDGISFRHEGDKDLTSMTLKEILDGRYRFFIQCDKEDNKIPVIPVYHPGGKRHLNRKDADEKKDWEEIKKRYDEIMGGA